MLDFFILDTQAPDIAAVKPYGVDSLTHTNEKFADGTFRKDIEKVKAFVAASRGVSES